MLYSIVLNIYIEIQKISLDYQHYSFYLLLQAKVYIL